jgi:hypothetical protein
MPLRWRRPAFNQPWGAIMSPQQLTSANAHRLIAEFISLGELPPHEKLVATARSEANGIEVIITVIQCTLAPAGSRSSRPAPAGSRSRLRPQKQKIIALLEGQPPRKANWIAIKLGKRSADGGLRATLSDMVASGELLKGSDGYGYYLPPANLNDSDAFVLPPTALETTVNVPVNPIDDRIPLST